jgi:hypothetical protein
VAVPEEPDQAAARVRGWAQAIRVTLGG